MRKESAIIRKCSAQRTGEPFHYASIQHILSNVMNAGILRSGETKSEVFPELQIVSLEQFNRVAKTREQRSVNYAIKCGGTTETVQLEDGTEATVVRPPRAYPRKIVGKALLSGNVYCGHCGGRIFAATARKTHRPTESNERIAIYGCVHPAPVEMFLSEKHRVPVLFLSHSIGHLLSYARWLPLHSFQHRLCYQIPTVFHFPCTSFVPVRK